VLALLFVLVSPPAAPGSPSGAGSPVVSGSPGASPAAILPAGPASVVADGVTDDATSSNNQVKVVREPSGALVVAYAADVGGVPQVVLARSRDGGKTWTTLGQASTGETPSRLPALGVDVVGRLHVVWTRYDEGVGKIYYRVWQGSWAAPQARISPTPAYAGFPALVVDSAGQPHVVWYGIREAAVPPPTRHGSIYEIFYTGFDGQIWSPPVLISTGLPDAVNPALAIDRAGRLHAAWYQFDGHWYQVRYAQRGTVWEEPETVLASRFDAFNPDLAAGPHGQIVLAWEHHDGTSSVIQATRRIAGRWEDAVDLSEGPSPARHPSVSVAPSGIAYVAWDDGDGQISVREFTTQWEPTIRLTGDGGNTYPSVAASPRGADLIWTHSAQGRSSVRYLRLGPQGSAFPAGFSRRAAALGVAAVVLVAMALVLLRVRRRRRGRA
jgi:hypothetical protein